MMNSNITLNVRTTEAEELHSHSLGELLYVLEGRYKVRIDGKMNSLEPEDIIWIPWHQLHSIQAVDRTTPLLCQIHVPMYTLTLDSQVPDIWCNSREDPDQSTYDAIRETLNKMLILYSGEKENTFYGQQSLCFHLLDLLITYYRVQHKKPSKAAAITAVIQYIQRNYADPVSLKTASEDLHYSNAYLSRLVKQHMGKTFSDCLSDVRMEHAAELLTSTQKQMTQISMECGFSSASALSKAFQKKYRLSPSAYRNAHQLQKQDEQNLNDRLMHHFGFLEVESEKEPDTSYRIEAGFKHPIGATKQIWSSTANIGHFADYIVSNRKQGILHALRELGIRQVRFSHIFDTRILCPGNSPYGDYNYSVYFGETLYELNENGMAPFFRIDSWHQFQAEQNGYDIGFPSMEAYINGIDSLLLHLSSFNFHYSQLVSWHFEVWEPDCTYMNGDYFRLYDRIYRKIKELLPGAMVGGCGARFGTYIRQQKSIVQKWSSSNSMVDFLSFSFYPYSVDHEKHQRYISDPDILPKELQYLLDEIHSKLSASIPVCITEWDAFLPSKNYFNDSLWRGCYFAKAFSDTVGKIDFLASSVFMDEAGTFDPSIPLHGAPGVITETMIKKPAFYSMRTFRNMEANILSNTPGCLIGGNGTSRVQIIVYNYRHFNDLFYMRKEGDLQPEYLKRYLEKPLTKHFQIEIEQVDNGYYQIEKYSCNKDHGSPLDQWIKKGCFEYTGKYRLLLLMLQDHVDVDTYSVEVTDNRLTFDLTVDPLEITSINVMKRF